MKLINKQTIVAALVGGVSALALTAGGVAFAHGAAHGGPHGTGSPWTAGKIEEHLTEMTERLDLSRAQQKKVRTIVEEAQTKAEEIKEMPRGKEKFEAFTDLRFTTEDQIYATLSCEQRDELRLLKREHKVERMQQRFERHNDSDDNSDK
jgi:Spy/CpxP family protein refolding chaperone